MKYKVLSIDFKEAKNHRFYREICVKEDLSLEYLGKILVFCLGGTLEHSYLFDDGEFSYVDKSWLGNPSDNYIDYSKTIVKQLPNKFLFEYDTGEGYLFNCRFLDDIDIPRKRVDFIVLKAKGLGLWEDNITGLRSYLSGEISPDYSREDDNEREDGQILPWNLNIYTAGEFDEPIDIKELTDYIKKGLANALDFE